MVVLNKSDHDRHMRVLRKDVGKDIGFPLFCWLVKDVKAFDQQWCFFEVIVGEEVMNDLADVLMLYFLEFETEFAKLIEKHAVKFNLQDIFHL